MSVEIKDSLKSTVGMFRRFIHSGTKFSLKKAKTVPPSLLGHPNSPVRARFAPSPTGYLHLGSLRTALYNYLIAKSTNGTFILRLEDTDRTRLVSDAEDNLYQTLKWLGLDVDEGPLTGGPYLPYRQSDRTAIYQKYIQILLDRGFAYRCFCSKERLTQLKESARLLRPPTTVSYDRHCLNHYTPEESLSKSKTEEYTIRFKSPDHYPEFLDLLHGRIDHQPQVNFTDRRYEDPILIKSDKMPTYHFANVVDDHLMKITHVIRGEEWLASTPKHISLYKAFEWQPPKFIHIPLLTTIGDKKLSKRSGDIDIMSLKSKGYLPEALINFSVLFGWSPKRELGEKSTEFHDLKDLEQIFTLAGLTIGNAKVDFKKLDFFNKHYFEKKFFEDKKFIEECLEYIHPILKQRFVGVQKNYVKQVLEAIGSGLGNINELNDGSFDYLFQNPHYSLQELQKFTKIDNLETIKGILDDISKVPDLNVLGPTINSIIEKYGIKKKTVYQVLRFSITGSQSGIKLPVMIDLLTSDAIYQRIESLRNQIS